jgi:hypothetical protein
MSYFEAGKQGFKLHTNERTKLFIILKYGWRSDGKTWHFSYLTTFCADKRIIDQLLYPYWTFLMSQFRCHARYVTLRSKFETAMTTDILLVYLSLQRIVHMFGPIVIMINNIHSRTKQKIYTLYNRNIFRYMLSWFYFEGPIQPFTLWT